jgi:LPPG:FO 2-phospho-L-lactate transferase
MRQTVPVRIVVLAGGVGGSRFTSGVRAAYPEAEITAVVNTADDITLHGLRICPDLDTMMYALGGGSDLDRGWGRAGETWNVIEELRAYEVEPLWFALGDRDIATHLVRTQLMNAGYPLSEVTSALCTRWLVHDPRLRLLPMTDDRVETHVLIPDPAEPDPAEPDPAEPGAQPAGRRTVHFQEYWVRMHAEPPALAVVQVGIEDCVPAPGVLDAIASADLILIGPSNPVVSIGPILAVPGVRAGLRSATAPVIGFSGILGGAPVLGMAHKLLPAIGVAVDAAAVGRHYGPRGDGGLLDLWVVDHADAAAVDGLRSAGVSALSTRLIMDSADATADFVRAAVEHLP